ncbi:meiotic nuclear division protein 1 [Fragilariopsis cylindrus CCMP1102]|uniref:Meiotic nuclear division protein 1 n=1 Tax=Fragilariopsis cylindrus CCMP1102 TaxID=635003 RepID=A0A1E7FYC7_9STRA|nr:meiotic nuclear division protein 1 [Fragilariopsis cylindrus CCMP1102]|eukprot:OEU22823.1 meiotic nuclear division protein 1 [Fragilariopsis cylindrus CCMP1102]
MGGTKRMNVEEKRKVIMGIYHKDQQVYTEKEILSVVAKAGVNANSIPDIIQGLIDDALVEKEKIGGSNYFWSFKAKKDRMAQIQNEKTLKLIEELKPQVAEAEARLSDAKRVGDDGSGRAKKLARLSELGQQKNELEKELEKLKENDPAALADLEKELQLVIQSANRWTDNIFECKSYLVKKRGMEKKEANKFLQISADFDCNDNLR